ncbi:MAG: ABC transporter substrate-binding protein, partial [Pseudorhodoplanes sp.]
AKHVYVDQKKLGEINPDRLAKLQDFYLEKGFMQTVVREDSGIEKPADLKGKTLTVLSFQDTTFYALIGLLASAGLTQNDVNVQQAGPTGVWESVATGKSQGMAGVPDWLALVEATGTKVKVIPTDQYFPHLAQGIAVSDEMIKKNPEMIQKFVTAAMRGMKDVMDNPDQAAADFVKFVPTWQGKEDVVKNALNYYAKHVYVDQKKLGEINPDRLAKLQDFYLEKGFMQTVVREDSGIEKPADLKGKTLTVLSFQDTTFYALIGLLASAGLTQNDVNV